MSDLEPIQRTYIAGSIAVGAVFGLSLAWVTGDAIGYPVAVLLSIIFGLLAYGISKLGA